MHELLLPAGNIEKAKYALNYGADAIYIGPKAYSLRARSSNFDFKEIAEISAYIHQLQKKLYIALNVICHNADIKHFAAYFQKINKYQIDGYIVADPFIIQTIKKINPQAEIHLSTQQSTTNSKACLFWKRNGVSRVVLSRELDYQELQLVIQNVNNAVEIESFIHGAVCISYSGRCMMSNNFSLRDANVGGCSQSCRWQYEITNIDQKLDKLFTMSPKDMALLPNFDQLLALNIASFKVEGRMKSIHYVATVANCYRQLIDLYQKQNQTVTPQQTNIINQELLQAANRPTDTAWLHGDPDYTKMLYFEIEKAISQIFAFNFTTQIDPYTYIIMARNFFSKKTTFEIVYPGFRKQLVKITKIIANPFENPVEVEKANQPMQLYQVVFDQQIAFQPFLIARSVYNQSVAKPLANQADLTMA